jgi:hypothetical protein
MAPQSFLGSLHGMCAVQTESFLDKCNCVVLDSVFVDCVDHTVCRGTLAFLLALLRLLCRSETQDFIQLRKRAEGKIVISLKDRTGCHCFDCDFIYVECLPSSWLYQISLVRVSNYNVSINKFDLLDDCFDQNSNYDQEPSSIQTFKPSHVLALVTSCLWITPLHSVLCLPNRDWSPSKRCKRCQLLNHDA